MLKEGEKLVLDDKFQNNTEDVCHCAKYKCSKDKVCLNNERGILLPGQSIVEHSSSGICHISYCTSVLDPATKFYQMNTSIIDCAARCKSHQVYERPKDLTTCCGKCKNVSCVYTFTNGTISYFKLVAFVLIEFPYVKKEKGSLWMAIPLTDVALIISV
ncbi:PREDICTED: otogelin-like, partial [Thamnophis sirtalis]|uniref:Otogelin-like n=1 Tax=Thamnophis sirtalis TaxID=35019 RepID=A0A6I9XTV0_9SAUR